MEKCGCEIKRDGMRKNAPLKIIFCPLHAAAQEMKAELERLRELIGEMDYEIVDAVIAKAERKK